jgi:hypothetical protein
MSRYHRAAARARENIAKAAAKESKDTTLRARLTPIQREERRQEEHAAAIEREKEIAAKDPEKAEAKKEKREAREQAAEEAKRFKKRPGRPTREETAQKEGRKPDPVQLGAHAPETKPAAEKKTEKKTAEPKKAGKDPEEKKKAAKK